MRAYKNIAETYESIRPGYPDELIADIIKAGNLSATSKLLEIGAGTGKATTAFLDLGFSVDANEIEPDTADVLRRRVTSDKLSLSVGSFESWVPPQPKYDCIQKPTNHCFAAFWRNIPPRIFTPSITIFLLRRRCAATRQNRISLISEKLT